MARFAVGLSLVLLVASVAIAQIDPAAGVLPFSTQGIGGVDLATSNVFVSIPIRSKAGKIPFSYGIVGNSHSYIWKSSANSSQWWTDAYLLPQPAQSFSWGALSSDCPGQGAQLWNLYVTDPTGAQHPVPGAILCSGQRNLLATATDGSGYTLSITGTYQNESVIVYDKAGNAVNVAAWSITDPDGATIVSSGSSYPITYTDSLGKVALTVGSNNTYTYTDAGGNNQSYSVSYTTYNFVTNFGCSGITESNYASFFSLPTSISTPTGAKYTISYEETPGYGSGNTTGRIASITYPSGGSISYSYSDSSGHNGINCTSGVVPTLKVTVNDNNGNSGTWTYVNSNTSATPGNFTVTETDPAGNKKVHSFAGEYQTQAVYYQGTSTVLKTVTTCYGVNGSAPPSRTNCPTPSTIPSLPITETDMYTSLGTSSYNEVQTKFDATYGNVTYTAAYDFGASSPTSQMFNFYGQSYSSPTACNAYSSGYINSTPCYSHTENSSGTDLAETKVSYNADGKPASVSRWTGATENTWLTTSFGYGASGAAAGVLSSVTDVNNAITTYSNFACNSVLPQTMTLPTVNIAMNTSATYDCNGGVRLTSVDVNGNPTTYDYTYDGADPLYRIKRLVNPDGGALTYSYNTGSSLPWTMTSSTSIGSGQPTVTATTVLDGLGRAVLASGITYSSTTDPNNSGGLRYGGVVYNNLGQVLYSYNPYFASTDQTSGYTTYQYDALGRKTNVETPSSNNIGFTYTNRAVEETDFAGFQNYQTITQFDGLGRMIDVCQLISGTQANGANPGPCSDPALGNLDISGTGFDTSYSYDALGRMTTATFWSQTRSFAYDGVGRMTSETTPEAGTKTYVYDHSPQIGDLYTRTAPLENHTSGTVVTTYAFDLLHRLTQVSYNDSLTPTISYAYDQTAGFGVNLTNYKGRLTWSGTSAAGINGANGWDAVFGYDAMGRVAEYSQCTLAGCSQGITFAQAFSYDYAGDLLTGMSTIAGGGTMNPTYNSIGQLTQLSTNCIALSGSSCVAGNVVSNIKYDALGQPVSDTLGTSSGLNEVWSYNKNGENTGYAAGATYNYALTYGQPTVITSSTDAVNGNWNYTYDSYNRLICAWKGSACNSSATLALNWTYDQFGNLWTQGLLAGTGFTKSFSYTQPAGGSINQITTAGYAYDAAGNMTNDTFHTYKYDADGRVLTVDGGTETAASGAVLADVYTREAQGFSAEYSAFKAGACQ